MKVSLHRRRHHSLLPRPRRSPVVAVVGVLITCAGVAWGARQLGEPEAPVRPEPRVAAAEQATRDVVDLRVRAHLRALPRG